MIDLKALELYCQPELHYLSGDSVSTHIVEHRQPVRANPLTWGIQPYAVVQSIEVVLENWGVRINWVEERQEVTVLNEGTLRETLQWRRVRQINRCCRNGPIDEEEIFELQQQHPDARFTVHTPPDNCELVHSMYGFSILVENINVHAK